MDTDIKKSNKIPGCEQLTRPEEIAALSKYLGEIKKVQEEHTKLGKDSLEVPGMSFGRENPNDPTELVDSVVGIDDKREGKLETTRISVSGKVQNVGLEEGLEKLEDNRESTLNAKTENLEVKEENKLGDQRVGLKTNPENTNLGTHTEKIEDIRKGKLDDKVEGLSDSRKITLSETKENLKDTRKELSLGDKTERLNSDPGIKELGNKRSELKDDREINLSGKIENLEDQRENTLSSFADSLDTSQDNTLSDTVSELDDTRPQQSLGDYILGIENEVEVEELVGSVISPSQSPDDIDTLEDHRENINPGQIENLREERRDIMGNEDVESLVPSPTYSDYLKEIIREANERRDENGLYNTAIRLFSEQDSEWAQRVAALMSAYLSGSRISPERAEEFENILAQSFIYPNSQLPNQSIRPDNISGNVEELEERREQRPEDSTFEDRIDDTSSSYHTAESLSNLDSGTIIDRPDNREFRDSVNGDTFSEHKITDPDEFKEQGYILKPTLKRQEDGSTGPNEGSYVWVRDKDGHPYRRLVVGEEDDENKAPSYSENAKDLGTLAEQGKVDKEKFQYVNGLVRVPLHDRNINSIADFGLAALNNGGVSSYLRWVAESTVGFGDWARGSLRTQLINEALALLVRSRDQLEKVSKINKDRLPGDDSELLSSLAKAVDGGLESALGQYGYTGFDPKAGVQGLVKSGINVGKNVAGQIFDKSEVPDAPFNRPKKDGKTTTYGYGNNLGNTKTSYFVGKGLETTLKDLCGQNLGVLGSLEDLNALLEKSELITTANKINKESRRTLDSNMYWEVVLKPWASSYDDATSNGGYSFLPDPREINTINKVDHGVQTSYNRWVPISSFELQKSKLTTKSLGLFDGEITYPVTSEYTNELRLTIVDDQWKSWKHYFQKCSDVAVYSSEPHDNWYYDDIKMFPVPTAVDKSTVCTAYYKNISFLVKIYVMTPQFSTIRKFSLLAVLKDFSEDYAGETDSGGSDLTVSFSIVGEVDEDKLQKAENSYWDKINKDCLTDEQIAAMKAGEETADYQLKQIFGEDETLDDGGKVKGTFAAYGVPD